MAGDAVKDISDKKTRREIQKLHALSAIIPILIMGTMFAIRGVYPFGNRQIIDLDFWHQYYPFISDLWHKLREGRSLVWSWTAGGGHDYIALIAYYMASPLNYIAALFPHAILREVLTASVLIKIGAAGLSMSIFLRCSLKKYDMLLPAFSSSYALCAFTLGYFWNIMWMDTFALFPLVMLGTRALLTDGKYRLYVISLAAAILFNFFIGFFVCVFVAIMFTVHCWVSNLKMKEIIRKLGVIAVFSTIAIGMTALLTIPVYTALQRTYSSTSTFPETLELHRSFVDVLGNFIAFTPPTILDGLPNLYSGMISVMLIPVFLISEKISRREKIAYMIVTVFLVLSTNVNVLDYMWNGFHNTNMIPYRFSFIISFILIYLAYRAYLLIKEEEIKKQYIIAMGLTVAVFLTMAAFGPQRTAHIIPAAALCAVYLLLFSVPMITKTHVQRTAQFLLFLLIIGELVNTSYIGIQTAWFTERDYYPVKYEQVQQLLNENRRSDTDFHRTEFVSWMSFNDGSLYGYDGITYFSSTITADVTGFMTGIGIAGLDERNRFLYFEASPLANAFLNIRYIISPESRYNEENTYWNRVFSADDAVLLENSRYLPLGFIVGEGVAEYKSDKYNPFKSQNDLFRKATGLGEDLFTTLEILNENHYNYDVDLQSPGQFIFAISEGQSSGTFQWNYEMPVDGSLYAFCRLEYPDSTRYSTMLSAVSEDIILRNIGIGWPCIFAVDVLSQGNPITFTVNTSAEKGTAHIYAGIFNQDVFEKGFAILSDETLILTEFSDTKIKGNISVLDNGLLYTSIPHVNQWKAYVNGSETNIVTIDGAMAAIRLEAGEHIIEFKHHNKSLTIGLVISVSSLSIFLVVTLLDRRQKRQMGKKL